MRKTLLHIIYIIIFTNSIIGIAQNYAEFETELIKNHGIKDTLVGDDLWIYDKNFNEIKEVNLEIFPEPSLKTYLVDMTWHLGYHVNDVKCIFTFNTNTKEIKFIGELWCNGFKEGFFEQFIYTPLENESDIDKFVVNLESLLKLNNPDISFENIYKENDETVIYMTHLDKPANERKLRNIIVLHHPKPRLYKIVILNTMGRASVIEK